MTPLGIFGAQIYLNHHIAVKATVVDRLDAKKSLTTKEDYKKKLFKLSQT